MRFTKLRLVGSVNVDLPIVGVESDSPFILKGVDGLGPPERVVKTGGSVAEGGTRQGTRAANRQVVALIGLQPGWEFGQTAADLRETLYGLLTPPFGAPVQVQIMDGDTVVAVARGDVSRCETPLFVKDPVVQVTIDCDYPYLLAPATISQAPAKTVSGSQTAIDILNDGTAPAGFYMAITLGAAQAGALRISENSASGRFMNILGPWGSGDKLIVDTRDGARKILRDPAGSGPQVSVLGNMTSGSTWLQLHGGKNRLLINSTSFTYSDYLFAHTPAYWGV